MIIKCNKHDLKKSTYVCQHIANSLLTRIPVGFFWSKNDKQMFPDAWCEDCEKRVIKTNGKWKDEALKKLNVKLLCSGCYLMAREMALGY